MEAGENGRASDLLRRLLDLPRDEEWEFEHNRDRELARSLIEQLGRPPVG